MTLVVQYRSGKRGIDRIGLELVVAQSGAPPRYELIHGLGVPASLRAAIIEWCAGRGRIKCAVLIALEVLGLELDVLFFGIPVRRPLPDEVHGRYLAAAGKQIGCGLISGRAV